MLGKEKCGIMIQKPYRPRPNGDKIIHGKSREGRIKLVCYWAFTKRPVSTRRSGNKKKTVEAESWKWAGSEDVE